MAEKESGTPSTQIEKREVDIGEEVQFFLCRKSEIAVYNKVGYVT